MEKKIRVTCTGAATIPYKEILDFQGDLKTIDEENLEKLKKEILDYGFNSPIHVWKSGKKTYNLDGHQRVIAVISLESEGYEVPDLPVDFIEAKTKKEARHILLSRISQYGKMSPKGLYDYLNDSQIHFSEASDSFSFPDIDMEKFEVKFFVDPEKKKKQEEIENDVPDKAPARCKYGDLWHLGNHRLLCGDARNPVDYEKLIGKERIDMIFTDPPYNVDYTGGTGLKIQNDKMEDSNFLEFLTSAFTSMIAHCKAGAAFYVCHADSEGLNFRQAIKDSGFLVKQCCIWAKDSLVMGRQDYQWKHEPILYGWKPGGAHFWNSDRSQTTVWEFERPRKSKEHPTMKPLALVAYAVSNSTKAKQNVLDPFGGSGSTLIACEKELRKCFSMEIDPKYCDVIIERWENYTGQKAKKQVIQTRKKAAKKTTKKK